MTRAAPGRSEGGQVGQVGHVQAAGREPIGEPPGEPASGLAGAAAHHGVWQRPDREPPDGLPGDTQPLRFPARMRRLRSTCDWDK